MKKKIKKFLYEYSLNSRISTKELGRKLTISQQSASYLVKSFRQKGMLIRPTLVVDPAKFGLITVMAFYSVAEYNAKTLQEVLDALQALDDCVYVEKLEESYDLAGKFCVPNLSHFNKLHRDFLQNFRQKLFIAEIMPVVVEHLYPRSYLLEQRQYSEQVINGDRDVLQLTDKEKGVLQMLQRDPQITVVDAAQRLECNPKTVIALKQKMEKNKIIRSYSAIWNLRDLGISSMKILLNSEGLSDSEDKKLLEFARGHPHIVGLVRLLGRYDLLIEVEGGDQLHRQVLQELRSEFRIREYKLLHGGALLKQSYVPSGAFAVPAGSGSKV